MISGLLKEPALHNSKDLAKTVHTSLKNNKGIPNQRILEIMFEKFFFASLKSEEGQQITVTLTYFPPNDPSIRQVNYEDDKWSLVAFKESIPLDVSTLVKLSKAADPWSSSVAISIEGNKIKIIGMLDQAIHLQSYLNLEDDRKPQNPPGLFQVLITGIGTLTVMSNFNIIATLKQGTLITDYLDVLQRKGPVLSHLQQIIDKLDFVALEGLNSELNIEVEKLTSSCKVIFTKTIKRILTRMKGYGHGGALLITSQIDDNSLEIKYPIRYTRIKDTISKYCLNITKRTLVSEDAKKELNQQLSTIMKELKGAIRFIASQSRVDGLVLLDNDFILHGFGVVIKKLEIPSSIYESTTVSAENQPAWKERKSDDFGTRHRSMFGYCASHPESLGFVISQDGDIRAIKNEGGNVIMWENILTQKGKLPLKLPTKNQKNK